MTSPGVNHHVVPKKSTMILKGKEYIPKRSSGLVDEKNPGKNDKSVNIKLKRGKSSFIAPADQPKFIAINTG